MGSHKPRKDWMDYMARMDLTDAAEAAILSFD